MKIIDSICEVLAQKAMETVKEVLSGFKPAERLLIVGLALVGLSFVSTVREENKKTEKDPRRSDKTDSQT